MLKASVTTDENDKCTCDVQVEGTAADILVDLSTVIHDVYKLLKGRSKDEFRIAFQMAALDPDGPFWNLDKIIGREEEQEC